MELKKRIGQLFVIGYQGLNPSDEFLSFVEEWGIGGIIFFVRNIGDPSDLPAVIRKLRRAAGTTQFTAIDQEGGLVLRILKGGSLFPGAMALSASDDPVLTRRVSAALAKEMRALGLNWNLAPVLDINHADNPGIGARSFGDTPERVARFGLEAIRGFQEGGVLACAKHFPGKGNARVDSHLSLPVIPSDRQHLWDYELFPFRKAIEAGVDAIMTAHVFFPAIEPAPNLPGTLSHKVLTGLLRDELGFKGLLVTDDLEMGAITEAFGVDEAARLSFLAGADLLLICHDLDRQRKAAQAVLSEIERSAAAKKRLEESLERITRARTRLGDSEKAASLSDLGDSHSNLIREASEKSILVARAAPGALPLSPSRPKLALCPELSSLVQVEETQSQEGIAPLLARDFLALKCVQYHPKASAEEIIRNFESAAGSSPKDTDLLLFSYNAHLFKGQIEAFRTLARRYPASILLALRNPYDLTAIPEPATAIASFGFRTPAIQALLGVLSGRVPPRPGPWPVTI